MFFFFLSIAIFGIIIFFTVIIFYKSSDRAKKKRSDNDEGDSEENKESEDEDYYIPVLHIERIIPGMGRGEVIHYLGSCSLFSLETADNPEQIKVDENQLTTVIDGEVALTSKTITIFNDENKKKFYFTSIEHYHFENSYLILKRKNVKRKKDILKIVTEPVSFKYILHALI
jgi:hypothetical protein